MTRLLPGLLVVLTPVVAQTDPPRTTVYHLADRLKSATVEHAFAGIHTRPNTPVLGDVMYRGIFQHANVPGPNLSQIHYQLDLPKLNPGEHLALVWWATLLDKSFDGVDFLVSVDGQQLFRRHHTGDAPHLWRVDLDAFAGQSVKLTLAIDPGGNNGHDGAGWADPRVVIEGRAPDVATAGIPPYWSLPKLLSQPEPDRIATRLETPTAATVVTVMDERLDLAAQTDRQPQPRAAKRRVPLGPRLVVSEGPDPENHTLVKVLNPHQMTENQFLAYPPEIRGGVQVEAGRDAAGETRIVAAPLSSAATREIRIFDALGGRVTSLEPVGLEPPYLLACGDLLPDQPGDELAVVGRQRLAVYDLAGKQRQAPTALLVTPDTMSLQAADGGASLLLYERSGKLQILQPATGQRRLLESPALTDRDGVYAGCDGKLLAAVRDPELSRLAVLDDGGKATGTLNTGAFENLFWVVTPPREAAASASGSGLHRTNLGLAGLDEGRYVKFCRYGHYRADAHSPGYKHPQFDNDSIAWWAGTIDQGFLRGRPCMWEPCFTHRGFAQLLGQWEAVKDVDTGQPKYLMSGRLNQGETYIEGEAKEGFHLTTYAFGLPALDHVYLDHLSLELTAIAEVCRRSPEANPSLEPNHENEIPMSVDATVGDYNPAMVAGFVDYLTRLYGRDPKHLNGFLGTDFSDWFDAPRWQDRGKWDSYGKQNPFFYAWLYYNRYVVNRRLAEGMREALLAGFPPEYLKFHQIPDTYIYGGDLGFSYVPNRITPLDFALSCGTGYGWTRYGVWFKQAHNVCQGGWSSGHDNTIVGEYQALSRSDDDAADQLRYLFDHGVQGIHAMGWNVQRYQETMTEAVRRLIAEDRPRPGVTGGVGQVRTWTNGARRLNLAVIGTGPERTGLLKSLNADGSWEGSVYVTPFKARVDIETIAESKQVKLPYATQELNGFDGGSQLELVCDATGGTLVFEVCHRDQPLPGLTARVELGQTSKQCRFVHRFQLPADGLTLRLRSEGGTTVTNLRLDRETARIAHLHRGLMEGRRHRGGVTFAVLPE